MKNKLGYVLAIAALCLAGCSTFSNREVTVDIASTSQQQNYFRTEIFNEDDISFEAANFIRGNLLPDCNFDNLPQALQRINDLYRVTNDCTYYQIAADLCNGTAKKCSDIEQSLQCWLAAIYYSREGAHEEAVKGTGAVDIAPVRIMLVYNEATSGVFRYLKSHGLLKHDAVSLVDIEGRRYTLMPNKIISSLPADAFSDFDAAAHFKVNNLRMQNRRFGFGVPVVAYVTQTQHFKSLRTMPGMTVPMTFFLRLKEVGDNRTFEITPHYFDTLKSESLAGHMNKTPNGRTMLDVSQMALDFSTPMAVFLNNLPERNLLSVMLFPNLEEKENGLYMIEPYDPDKIPVVFVHGLMSSPGTWINMINGLKNSAEIRRRYQFWFFKYSSGMPVMVSANLLREQLMQAYEEFAVDEKTRQNLERTVIVGHSMGGLITRSLLQKDKTFLIEKMTDASWSELCASLDEKDRAKVEKLFAFPALPFVHRAVFMAVPHRGAEMAQSWLAKFGASLVTMPISILEKGVFITKLSIKYRNNQAMKKLAMRTEKRMVTGIDNLDPDNPFILAIGNSPMKDDLTYHSIIGNVNGDDRPGDSDGIVPYTSSHLDGAASEWIVKSGHSVHCTPRAIRELHRILLLHLRETEPGAAKAEAGKGKTE